MRNTICISGIVCLLILGVQRVNAVEQRLTTGTLPAAIGKDICSLNENWTDKFGVYLEKQEKHSVEFRGTSEVTAFFLIVESNGIPKYCGRILDVLNVAGYMKQGKGVEYKCDQKGKKKGHWGNIFGLSKDGAKSGNFVTPFKAWKVNHETWKFEEISNKGILCDTTGFED